MQKFEQQLQQRFPHWFRGRRARLAQPLLRAIGRWSRFDAIAGFLARSGHLRDFEFVRGALDFLQARYVADAAELRRIPASGRLLIVANHPSGALDALALLDAVGQVRRDVRIIANDLLSALEPLSGLLLPIRIVGGRPGAESLHAVEQALRDEVCVIVFPAGEVARLGLRGVTDGRWRRGFLRFARATATPVLPVRVETRNSALFYGASALFKPAGTALLAREMFARGARRIALRIGHPLRLPADGKPTNLLRQVRRELHAIGTPRERVAPIGPEALVDAVDPAQVRAGVEAMELLGQTFDGKQIRVGRLAAGAPLLREIGRLRELTFRAVGEGTGLRLDVDLYDSWYEHIVLWDAAAGRIAGAYRLARGAAVLPERGLAGFYTASLFDYADDALPRMREGMELGRSFVAPEYWGSRSIDYLWQGIGAYLLRHPDVRYLFGPVSISAALPIEAREQIVAYYARYYGSCERCAASKQPFAYRAAPPRFGDDLDAAMAFRVLRNNLDALGATLPMLYKQYTDLCEPGGARFLAFGVDPAFSDSVDGLIEVDLQRLRAKKRERYLVAAETRAVEVTE
ncbi:lysophospholipid acyltransferase family protein [Lysobacter solisilvae (ex Woo and Kim 2020)]|uniref:L-ornithine N(alpha)-acyltransferase n=1 Tax=Agrilutibacter terrestris TaxID=2865112 RepID=A0A7H0FUV4_9GAMM|nr:lysophospholipid acyltransferase family protein [Lysobacter terrestris]QNP39820.1 lysophospholipid acyltransferase family protein [Lysobacter terrestris]